MMFRRLLESTARAEATRAAMEGLAVSTVAHLTLLVLSLAGGADRAAEPEATGETISMVEYLIPPDKLAGSRPQEEKVSFDSRNEGSGRGFAGADDIAREVERLQVPITKGEEKEEEAAEQAFEAQPPIALGDSIMTEYEVDSAVTRYEDSAAPTYPEIMLRRQIQGHVVAQYVVDTTGFVDVSTFRVVEATHAEFVRAVRAALPFMRFRPAKMGSRKVAQLVQQPFTFQIAAPAKPPLPPDGVSDSPRSPTPSTTSTHRGDSAR